ncbi:MAG: DUF4381 domain-containing protein [Pseudomonadales bacterium]|jgi:hypothetical protein|nr:DUF4381 domain-containing protein [Pseudomonadales bacterium]MDP6471334.1 DUF4381 domain-containing protein [Pseudomonadales bacterium]MDP6826475.1 DUF4381 domain-containing protein [Pseudomonadales bacterium]MDP6970070.1 DUF4381 domain-containing protein [Pseudomonadales bacterium]|tara:strand:+ start:520 stop:1026 length:507 start_codon:yes stop_codon:yes gene_type:complete
MHNDLLQQLRDIHAPLPPYFWPPAPGWWLLAALAVGLVCYALWRLIRRWRRFAAAREACSLYRRVYANLAHNEITPGQYLHAANALLKRLAIFGSGHGCVRPLTGTGWLRYLDQRHGSNAFSSGPGRCLDHTRFTLEPVFDQEALHALLSRYFRGERARFWKPADSGS